MLVIGELGPDHRDGGHQAGKHRADSCDMGVDIHNDPVRRRPHIVRGIGGHGKKRRQEKRGQGKEIQLKKFLRRHSSSVLILVFTDEGA